MADRTPSMARRACRQMLARIDAEIAAMERRLTDFSSAAMLVGARDDLRDAAADARDALDRACDGETF